MREKQFYDNFLTKYFIKKRILCYNSYRNYYKPNM